MIRENIFTMYSAILSAIINIILNILLIPNYGMEGAAVATASAYIVINN
ncbi:polysaccharide biosynthesis C-terminal domain-containing protein [Pyrococcus abyssi]